MNNEGVYFYGFTNGSQPSQAQLYFDDDMISYINYTGWTNGHFPAIIEAEVPQVSGGTDSFGNAKIPYNFVTTEVPSGLINSQAWYTWIIPTVLTNNQVQTSIGYNSVGDPNSLAAVFTESTIYQYTFTYVGSVIPEVEYRVYTTYPGTEFRLTDTNNIYFRGNTVT
jgi:hypothetical protein